MRKNRLAVAILLVMVMLLGIMTTAFAADYTPVDPDDQGKTGIVGGDTLTFTEDTVWANLTARWGVRVIFQDGDEWNNTELKSELIPVTDSAAGNTTAPDDPSHDGWTFTGWERVDTNNGSSTLNDDGTVTGINGPGPIIYKAIFKPTPEPTPEPTPGPTPGPTPPDKPGDPGTPKTGDDSNIALWISLLLASFIGMMACIVLFRKKRAGKHMKTFMMLLLVGVMAFSCFGVTSAFAAEDGTTGYTYGQYDMTYLPGTADTVTNMPANETGLTPGADSPYTVSSTVPVREGFEFIDWTLTWGTMEKQPVLTDYVVKYLDKDTNEPVADEKTESGLEVGTSVTETAIPVGCYTAVEPTEATLVLAETGNEIIFYYEKQPVLTDYVVKYLDKDTNEPVADEKTESGLEVGTSVTENAIPVDGYTAVDPTEATLVLAETGNEIIFYYEKLPVLTGYVVKYVDVDSGEPLAPEKEVGNVEIGSEITEVGVDIFGYILLPPSECTLVMGESGNVFIFYYYYYQGD
ncbi:sortase B protein-sorting domain-containing protein [Ruthenibacterium lactatiformans]|uniref:sortase B protein-sorting domain-containing protein n=1 Tax=Ruthenibacterium lactatiformans TaxID=1550024 RepID=UPI0018678B90|nr:sortase B protein-sorting domain-containing protein [Ruthenibacterium lactatiformans]